MKILDKKGRLFGLVNLIDLLVLIILIVALVFIAPNFLGGVVSTSGIGADAKDVYFTIELAQTTEEFADKIQIGDLIKDNLRGYYYGTVSDITVMPSVVTSHDMENAKYVRVEMPERYDIHLTVKCNGTESDKTITAEGQEIKLGKMMVLKSKGYVAAGYVISLRTE